VAVTALLVKAHMSPKCQIFAECGLVQEGGQPQRAFDLPGFPFTVRVMDRPSRSGRDAGPWSVWRALSLSTSDELATWMLSLRVGWRLFSLGYYLDDGDPLLQMVIAEQGPEVVAPPARAVRKPAIFEYLDAIDVALLDQASSIDLAGGRESRVSRCTLQKACSARVAGSVLIALSTSVVSQCTAVILELVLKLEGLTCMWV
jgi:hypothetical protein